MSVIDKLRTKFTKKPPPKDLRWDELVRILKSYSFDLVEENGGSHNYFVAKINGDVRRINASRPHPEPIVKIYKIKEITQKLNDWGML